MVDQDGNPILDMYRRYNAAKTARENIQYYDTVNNRKRLDKKRNYFSSSKMCDLIDLNSPDVKGLLASPLIPTPENVEFNKKEQTEYPMMEKRESPGSNPFDKALHETAEYITKKGDPFEVMLQRALKCKSRKNAELRVVGFMDDFTPKRRKRYLKTMNKTLDDSLIEDNTNLFNDKKEHIAELGGATIGPNANNANIASDNKTTEDNTLPKQSREIFVTDKSLLESSILNQSAMNDTLLEVDYKHKENSETSIFIEEDALPNKCTFYTNSRLVPLHLRHSSVQEGRGLSENLLCVDHKRSKSTTNASRKTSRSDSSAMSNFLEKGFLESKQDEQSIFSTLSNVSSIAKLNSISHLSSSLLSNATMNHAFLDSGSLKMNQEKINTTENSLEIKPMQCDLSDLVDRLNKLKCTIDRTPNVPSIKKNEPDLIKEENEQVANDKLIDVDTSVSEPNFSKEHNKSATSNTSSDSVFVDNSKFNKSIFNEAKALARTFEELTPKTDSESSIDLISNNDEWMSELVPAFEDEAVIDNLIELSVSPKGDEKSIKESIVKKSASIDNEEDFLQKTESKVTDSTATVKQTIVTTLLLDLKKLVKVENNSEAAKLIDNLENVLDMKCINNTELLTTCLNISNGLQTSVMVDNKSDTEQSNKLNISQSQEEKKKILPEENICDSEKSLLSINHESDNTSPVTTVSSDTSSPKISSCENNNENSLNTTSPKVTLNKSCNEEKNKYVDEKLAIELLVNLGKLLSGQTKDTTTLQLLKNIGKALNIASYNHKIPNESETSYVKHNIKQIIPLKISKSKRDANSSISNKMVHERSFESKSKPLKKTRRSISITHSPTKNMSNTQTYKHKDTSESKSLKKRFSSDPGLLNTITYKKVVIPETCNTKKVETAELHNRKEKSLAISDVKNKLKKKSDGVNRKGPMKAVHPIGNMQKKASLSRSTILCSQNTTPPKSDKTISSGGKIISSTPNSVDNNCMLTKVGKSKPVASSTPDGQHGKMSNVHLISSNSSKKRNFSCDISPVTTHANNNDNDDKKDSPVRSNKLPTPKKFTPKRQQTESSGIPKYLTPPRKHGSSLDMHNRQPLSESPQYLNRSFAGSQRYSPICPKNTEKKLHSPLKDSNKIATKVKPLKLISKLKRYSINDCAEKENNYA